MWGCLLPKIRAKRNFEGKVCEEQKALSLFSAMTFKFISLRSEAKL